MNKKYLGELKKRKFGSGVDFLLIKLKAERRERASIQTRAHTHSASDFFGVQSHPLCVDCNYPRA
jgi:hypothetical protein